MINKTTIDLLHNELKEANKLAEIFVSEIKDQLQDKEFLKTLNKNQVFKDVLGEFSLTSEIIVEKAMYKTDEMKMQVFLENLDNCCE